MTFNASLENRAITARLATARAGQPGELWEQLATRTAVMTGDTECRITHPPLNQNLLPLASVDSKRPNMPP